MFEKIIQHANFSICSFSFPGQEVFKSHFIAARDVYTLTLNTKHITCFNVVPMNYRSVFIIDNGGK